MDFNVLYTSVMGVKYVKNVKKRTMATTVRNIRTRDCVSISAPVTSLYGVATREYTHYIINFRIKLANYSIHFLDM